MGKTIKHGTFYDIVSEYGKRICELVNVEANSERGKQVMNFESE